MIRVLWVLEKEFDVSLDTATWLEMIAHIQEKYDILLLTGYKKIKVKQDFLRRSILYYDSARIPIAKRITSYLSQIRRFSSLISFFRPSLVLFNVTNPLLLRHAVSLRKKYRMKLISDVRTLPISTNAADRYISERLFSLNLRYAAKSFDGITYITEEMKQFCISTYNLPKHSDVIWTSGVNTKLFRPSWPQPSKPNDEPIRLLYHGAMSKNRGLDNCVRALSMLNDVDVSLYLLGQGDAFEHLEELAAELHVEDRVKILKAVRYRDVPAWINRGDVGILPFPSWSGWNTSSPIKLFEYLSCGKPVVITDIPAHRNVLHGQEFAFWSEESSPEALARAIRRVCGERLRLESLGKSARNYVVKHFTWEQQAKRLMDFLEYTLQESN